MTRKNWWLTGGAMLLVLVLILALLRLGEIPLSFSQVLAGLLGTGDRTATLVVWQLRLPYAVAALICGVALSVSGLLLQTLTQNPLVDSSILGINAGARLGAVIAITLGLASQWLPLAAILGACLALVLVGTSANNNSLRLLLRGVAMSAMLSGVILLLQLNMNSFDFERVLVWLSGSFWNVDWGFLQPFALATIGLVLLVTLMARPLALMVLGADLAQTSGVNVRLVRLVSLCLAVALAAVAVTVGGAIALVGLMAPNIAARLCGHRFGAMLAMSILLGAAIMLLATIIANNVFLPSTLPVGLVVAVITMPYFLVLLFRR